MKNRKEINVPLLRKRNLALGRASYEDLPVRSRDRDNDTPIAMQLDENEDDPLMSIGGGAEFGLLATTSGKVKFSSITSELVTQTNFAIIIFHVCLHSKFQILCLFVSGVLHW